MLLIFLLRRYIGKVCSFPHINRVTILPKMTLGKQFTELPDKAQVRGP